MTNDYQLTLTEGRILIYDMKGLKQMDQKLPIRSESAQLSVSNSSPGTYITQIEVDGIHESKRIVIQ